MEKCLYCYKPLKPGQSTAFVLKEVQVKGSRITGRDTISFDLTRFANERDNSLKDVLKKLPGIFYFEFTFVFQ